MGKHSLYLPDKGAIVAILSRAKRPLSIRIISRKLFGGRDRAIKGLRQALGELLAENRIKAVPVKIHHGLYEHYIAGLSGMQEYHIAGSARGLTARTLIVTDDPGRAVSLVKLLAGSGKWDELTVKANKTTYTLENLGDLV